MADLPEGFAQVLHDLQVAMAAEITILLRLGELAEERRVLIERLKDAREEAKSFRLMADRAVVR